MGHGLPAGASYVDQDIYGIPTEKVEEFTAVGVGGLALTGPWT